MSISLEQSAQSTMTRKSTETKVRALLGDYGTVTDCSLKYNKDGIFRRFAFIGFSTDEEAQAALDSLNNTYLETSKIQIQLAKDLTQSSSKHSVGTPNIQPVQAEKNQSKAKPVHAKDKILGKLEEDEGFQEFLDIHKASHSGNSWKNDDEGANSKLIQKSDLSGSSDSSKRPTADYAFEGDSDESSDDERGEQTKQNRNTEEEFEETIVAVGKGIQLLAKDKTLSDMDYLRKKTGKLSHLSDDEDTASNNIADRPHSDSVKTSKNRRLKKKREEYVVKLKNLPLNVNRNMIQGFLQGITIKFLDIPRSEKKTTLGVAFAHFKTEKELEAALRRNRNMMGSKKVTVVKAADKDAPPQKNPSSQNSGDKLRTWELKNSSADLEPIADSGRLFIRNLAHTCTEEDLEKLFSAFGALTDVNLPIDPTNKRIKGFAHITYMFPEHAVQAYNKLDGTNYKGRLIHILPGKPRKEEMSEFDENGDYRKKLKKEQKQLAQSSHNWNSLFLGANAVANVMSSKYGIDKSQLLDAESSQSLGVRLALGETEVVNETRDFLLENGVSLDSFSQASAPRSKTVILVKNLPSQTPVSDMDTIFSPFGTLGRLIMPPAGISALVEFQEPHEAKAAFTKLAYTRFKHVPLYLEWAPVNVFGGAEVKEPSVQPKHEQSEATHTENVGEVKQESGASSEGCSMEAATAETKEESDEEREGDDASVEGCTLFVKNLNFQTTEESLKKHFKCCGKVVNATVATKRDPRKPGQALSMGYGFIQFKSMDMAQKAIRELQRSKLDNHNLELKLSERTVHRPQTVNKKKQTLKMQTSTKILVRNIPFQANRKEITELFKVFGELKTVRLPKKVGGPHRGFAFVDFITKNDAKRAFDALCHSTHLYARRLVLEWADSAEESIDNLRKKTADGYTNERSAKKFKRADMQAALEQLEVADED